MKNSFKRILAIMLCLALTIAIIPIMVFADVGKPGNNEPENTIDIIIPGEVNVLLKEPYYSYGDTYPDLREILPEIEIESYTDLCLSVILASNKSLEETNSIILSHVGTEFTVKLTEKTAEATENAVELLKSNPYVKWAGANTYYNTCIGPGEIIIIDPSGNIVESEVTVADALDVLRVAVGLSFAVPEKLVEFDKDNDGEITVADALTVLRVAAKLA